MNALLDGSFIWLRFKGLTEEKSHKTKIKILIAQITE